MENQTKKCSFKDHREIDANYYCLQCKINLCNKCEIFHSKLLENHLTFSLDKNIDEIFTGFCKEKNHNYYDLSFFCKTHNILCCAYCITKIKRKELGKHRDCEICLIENIKEEKIIKLKENIRNLEELSNDITKSIKELKDIFEKMNKNKEELKINIQKIFTEIRNELNNREDELLLEVEKQYDDLFFKEEFIKETEKLPNRIKISLEKGNQINENNNENNLNILINDCINIEKIIEEINTINKNIKKCKNSTNIKINLNIEKEKEIKEIIKTFGKIEIDNKNEKNYDIYNDFNIKLKESIHTLNFHSGWVCCLTILKDGRLVSGSGDNSIIIYNKITYKPDLIIKEHNNIVSCIIQLSSGELASCSADKEIKIFKIKDVKYEILQTLKYHTKCVFKIIELKNKNLVSCSEDSSIIFYYKDNLEYKNNYKISTNGGCFSVIQTKDNEICYSENKNKTICFYDLFEKKIKSSLSGISKYNGFREWFIMMTNDLLLIPGDNKISIINVNQYKLVRVIEVLGSSSICGVCILNKNMILTGDYSEIIRQWRIEGDNLVLVSKKEKTHNSDINVLLNMGNGYIASGSDDKTIKIW